MIFSHFNGAFIREVAKLCERGSGQLPEFFCHVGMVVISAIHREVLVIEGECALQQMRGVAETGDPGEFFRAVPCVVFEFTLEMPLAKADFLHKVVHGHLPVRSVDLFYSKVNLPVGDEMFRQPGDEKIFDFGDPLACRL